MSLRLTFATAFGTVFLLLTVSAVMVGFSPIFDSAYSQTAGNASSATSTSGHTKPEKAPRPDESGVAYGDHPQQRIDVWLAESDTPTPVLVFFHGGSFTGGHRFLTDTQRHLLKRGISAVSADYRLTEPEGITVADSMQDAARVIQFLRFKAAELNIDPQRIAVMGGSAGGCISMWLATHPDLADPDSDDPVARQSSRVQCAFGSGAQTTLDPEVILGKIGGNPTIHPAAWQIFDFDPDGSVHDPKVTEVARQYSALNFVSKNDPPVYLTYRQAPPEGLYPPDANGNETIHSAKFGLLLKKQMDKFGLTCVVSYPGNEAAQSPEAFLLAHLQPLSEQN